MRYALPLLGCLLATGFAVAAGKDKIDASKKAGVEFLKASYAKDHSQGLPQYGVGGGSLTGLALLECGVSKDDAVTKLIADQVRNAALSQSETYQIALAIIFLDRYGDAGDIPLIQMLGLRLYAGMNSAGGWTYTCWSNTNDSTSILKSLQTNTLSTKPLASKQGQESFNVGTALHPDVSKLRDEVLETLKSTGRSSPMTDDNSNTQFGIVGLWVASRHGLPMKDAFALIERRFLLTQSKTDGGWSYNNSTGESVQRTTVAMTCAGLLGLAVGVGSRDVAAPKKEKNDAPPGSEDDPFFNPKKDTGDKADPLVKKPPSDALRSAAAVAALKSLGAVLNGVARGGGGSLLGGGSSLYTLWSLERMCVAYNLETLGGLDWYDIVTTLVLGMQQKDGSFSDTYGVEIGTSFALLILAKANFTRELSSKIKTKDPGKAELRAGGSGPPLLNAPVKPGQSPPKEKPIDPGFSLPGVVQPTVESEGERIAVALQKASDAEWKPLLLEAKNGKGAKWTRGLVLTAARVDGDRRTEARDALAERLTRMTPETLKAMLKDNEFELRRAAVLACAMKEDRERIPDVIARIGDANEAVVRAARAALKSYAPPGTDYGPPAGADDAAKAKATMLWTAWHEKSAK